MFSGIFNIPITRRSSLSRGKIVVWTCEQDSTYQRVSTSNVTFVPGIYLVYPHDADIYNKQTNIYNLTPVATYSFKL